VREPQFRAAAQQLGQHIREEAEADAAIAELEQLAQRPHTSAARSRPQLQVS
jgi:hypothetical protein